MHRERGRERERAKRPQIRSRNFQRFSLPKSTSRKMYFLSRQLGGVQAGCVLVHTCIQVDICVCACAIHTLIFQRGDLLPLSQGKDGHLFSYEVLYDLVRKGFGSFGVFRARRAGSLGCVSCLKSLASSSPEKYTQSQGSQWFWGYSDSPNIPGQAGGTGCERSICILPGSWFTLQCSPYFSLSELTHHWDS